VKADAVRFVKLLQIPPDLAAENAFERNLFDRNNVDLDTALPQGRRGFERDETGPDDDGACARLRLAADRTRIGHRTQGQHIGVLESGQGQPIGLRAGGDQQSVEPKDPARPRPDGASFGVDAIDLGSKAQIDVIVGVPVIAAQPQPFLRRGAGEIILGKVRAIARRIRVGTQNRQVSGKAATPQFVGAGEAGRASADDDDLSNVRLRWRRSRVRPLDLAPHEYPVALDFNLPAIDGIERGSAQHPTGPQVEACVVERTPDRGAVGHAVGQCGAIMRAHAADREKLAVEVRQQDRGIADTAGKGALGRDFADAYAAREIRSPGACRFTHLRNLSSIHPIG
jgi:hypothetical protein